LVNIKFKKLDPEATIPQAMTGGAAGLDLVCLNRMAVTPNRWSSKAAIIHTGLAMELPEGYYAEVVLRSSTGRDTKLRLANQVGIIDSDYRGEIMLYVENLGDHLEIINAGQRIAQLLIHKIEEVVIEEATDELSKTERGLESGSTGKGTKPAVKTRKTKEVAKDA
jgi:dUTP pyrophosphatase